MTSAVWGDLLDRHGMLPAELFCLRCGKTLNADGNHPAELYGGTFNGLCYGCTKVGPYVAKVAVLDGCRVVSWPPHCPSWRRDREEHYAYEGCETCGGLGIEGRTRWDGHGGQYCRPCLVRYSEHPLQVWYWKRWHAIRDLAQAVFDRRLDEVAGVPRKCSAKRRAELRNKFVRQLGGPEMWTAYRRYHPVKVKVDRLLALHAAKGARLGVGVWTEPPEVRAQFEKMVARRAADLGITE